MGVLSALFLLKIAFDFGLGKLYSMNDSEDFSCVLMIRRYAYECFTSQSWLR